MIRKFFLVTVFVSQFPLIALTQANNANSINQKPKLVVGLVIDQMRWDFLYRYNDLYIAGGFKRLLKDGYSCENTLIPYMPTYTAPGHTCVYTGSVPAIHGIIGNNWFDKPTGTSVYCTEDDAVETLGSNSLAGKMSPKNLWATTITDELRLATNFKSKVIGIALKDRGAILPAGHSANAAYWYDGEEGKWISSTYYMKELPVWVNDFNANDFPAKYMSKSWNLDTAASLYVQSTEDNMKFEGTIMGEAGVVFPHQLASIKTNKYEAFKTTPFASTFTFDFAKTVVKNEQLGNNSVPDFLTVSISSTDYIGHTFGPNSMEIEDTYLKLDKDIAGFLQYLDETVGKDNYLFFLTADHGVAHVPGFLKQHGIPAGVGDDASLLERMNQLVADKMGIKNAISTIMNYQLYLKDFPPNKRKDIISFLISELKKQPSIVTAMELEKISDATLPEPQKKMMINGYTPKRSGDIQFVLKPGYFNGGTKGTTHGIWNPYDAHIPLLFYGWNVKQGNTNREIYMTDIAATIAAMLQIQMPSGCVGKVITEVIK